jgi:radical SAM-linked protein
LQKVGLLRQKIKINFAKEGPLRFISHHDTMRLFERALRRANIEVRQSEGFNPRPKMSFALPLALGIESECEALFVETTRWLKPDDVAQRLGAVLPPGMRITGAEVASAADIYPSEAEYTARLGDEMDREALSARAEELLGMQSLTVERTKEGKETTIDLRPYLLDLRVQGDAIFMKLRVTPRGTARPEEILKAMGVPLPQTLRVKRTALRLTRG